jgi:hypothetical protein
MDHSIPEILRTPFRLYSLDRVVLWLVHMAFEQAFRYPLERATEHQRARHELQLRAIMREHVGIKACDRFAPDARSQLTIPSRRRPVVPVCFLHPSSIILQPCQA